MTAPTSDGRRVFLRNLLAGAATAGAVMIFRQSALAALAGESAGEADEAEHDYAFIVDINKCIGCGNCVKACRIENDVPDGQFRTWIERYVVTDEGVHVDSPEGGQEGFSELPEELMGKVRRSFFVPKLCNQCRSAPCVQVCPVGATFQTKEGFVLVDPTHCIGCSYCVMACPYGVRYINEKTRVADKCTWCHHRVVRGKLPACVTVCPTDARQFGDLMDPESEVARVFAREEWKTLKPHMHTESLVLYLGLPREVV